MVKVSCNVVMTITFIQLKGLRSLYLNLFFSIHFQIKVALIWQSHYLPGSPQE
jgi:hypothetical protein